MRLVIFAYVTLIFGLRLQSFFLAVFLIVCLKDKNMNKAELVEKIADEAELSKASAERALNSAIDNIIKAVTKGDPVQLVGFGTFSQGKRSARVGRNPKTGEAIKIAASKTAKFSAGKAFKDSVNKRK